MNGKENRESVSQALLFWNRWKKRGKRIQKSGMKSVCVVEKNWIFWWIQKLITGPATWKGPDNSVMTAIMSFINSSWELPVRKKRRLYR